MTVTARTNKDKKREHQNIKRNKTTDAYGNKYDSRKGSWSKIDEAVRQEGRLLDSWLKPIRLQVELCILNYPGKPGRRYEYPPSLILFISLLQQDDGRSYRRAISKLSKTLERMRLPEPHYSTLHKNQMKYERGGFGAHVMSEATVILVGMGVKEVLDPLRIINSGVCPEYQAPQLILTCQADVDRQKELDKQAAELGSQMHVTVMRSALESDRPLSCAIDGSGESLSGPGLYIEHIWRLNNRRFIKQHTMIDLDNQRVVSFAITLEKPGDAKMFVPLVKGALLVGANVQRVSADSAYDTKCNWSYMDGSGIEFCPNLKESKKDCWGPDERKALASLDEAFGKELAHRMTGYNSRWLVEVFFSIFKRLYGEHIGNRLFPMMVISMNYRYVLYDIHRDFMIEARKEVSI